MNTPIIYGLIVFLHDLFTAIWIGGLLFLGLIFFPVLKQMEKPALDIKWFSLTVQNRIRAAVYISIVGLFITGILMAKQATNSIGMFNLSTPYNTILSIKHLLIFVMVTIGLVRSLNIHRQWKNMAAIRSPLKQSKQDGNSSSEKMAVQPQMNVQEKKAMVWLFFNMTLGILVLLLSGLLAAF